MINNLNLIYFLNNSYHKIKEGNHQEFKNSIGLIVGLEIIYLLFDFINFIFFIFFIIILKFKRSNINLGLDDVIKKILYSGTIILKKKIVKKSKNKFDNFLQKKNIDKSIDYTNNYNLFVQKLTQNHLKFIDFIINYGKISVVIGNFTTTEKDALLLSEKGELHEQKNVYLYNKVSVNNIDDNKLQDVKQLIEEYKDLEYSNKIQTSKELSLKINSFIKIKSSEIINEKQEIFLKNKNMNEKIQIIEKFLDNINKLNSRED